MRRLVDTTTMQALDAWACRQAGTTAGALMESAARAACGLACSLVPATPSRILVLAGPGNNGADGLAAARLLQAAGHLPEVRTVSGRSGRTGALWAEQARRLTATRLAVTQLDAAASPVPTNQFALIIDALAGVGQTGALTGGLAQAVDWLNAQAGAAVLSLDLPSGLHDVWKLGEPCVRATHTLCFGQPKLCLYASQARAFAGQISVADIGLPDGLPIPPDAPGLILDADLGGLVPKIHADSHKFDRGSVAILAGSRLYPGALELCARAALGSRAGMVHVLADPGVFEQLPGLPPELLRHQAVWTTGEGSPDMPFVPSRCDALCVGPGWGREPGRPAALRALFALCRQRRLPMVLDADGLDALGRIGPAAHAGLILTPHAGELAHLAGCESAELAGDPRPVLLRIARQFQATVLLKGPVTWIVSPDSEISVYDGANPLLAQAGSGDILAGIMAAVLALLVRQGQGVESAGPQAARVACLVLAATGRRCARLRGWAPSSVLVGELGGVWAGLDEPRQRGTTFWQGGTMIQSVAGVLMRDGRVLLARRKPGGDMGGRWELPGGKCEGAEGPVAALIREFDEEFSLLISVGEPCAEASFRHHGKEHRVRAYFIGTEGNFDKLAEHDQVAWFGLNNLPPRASIVDSDADLLDQLARHGK